MHPTSRPTRCNFEGYDPMPLCPPEYLRPQQPPNDAHSSPFAVTANISPPPFENDRTFFNGSPPVSPYDNNMGSFGGHHHRMDYPYHPHFSRMRYRARPGFYQRQRFSEPRLWFPPRRQPHRFLRPDHPFPLDLSQSDSYTGGNSNPVPRCTRFFPVAGSTSEGTSHIPQQNVPQWKNGRYNMNMEQLNEEYVPKPISVMRARVESIESADSSSNSTLEDESAASSSSSVSSDVQACPVAYVAAVTKYVDVEKQRTERRAAFGVWVGDDNDMNFGLIMPSHRPQCLKAVLIYAGAKCVDWLKKKGFNRVHISMESEYLVKNVAEWLKKSSKDSGFEIANATNWDEHKYANEIAQLCSSFKNMRINWVHLSTKCEYIEKAKQLANEAIKNSCKVSELNDR